MRKYHIGEILFCGVLRRYVSQNIVTITGTLRLNRFTFLYVFNWDINDLTFDYYWKQLQRWLLLLEQVITLVVEKK